MSRYYFDLTDSDGIALDEEGMEHGAASRSDAIRRLVEIGLKAKRG